MVVGVRGGCPGSGGGRAGWVAGVLRVHVDVWLALVGLGRAGRCRVALWVRGGPLGCFGGVLEACGWRWGACAGRRVG